MSVKPEPISGAMLEKDVNDGTDFENDTTDSAIKRWAPDLRSDDVRKWILVLSAVVVSMVFARSGFASELLDRMLWIDECSGCDVVYRPSVCAACAGYPCGDGYLVQAGADSGYPASYPASKTVVDTNAVAAKTDQLIEALDATQGTLDQFSDKTDGQLRGLQHDVEATREQIANHSQASAADIDSLAKQLQSLAKKTDGQLRGLSHDAEATRTQITNQSKAELDKLDALAAQLKDLAEKTDGQLRGLIHDAEATHKQLEFLTKAVAANGKQVAAMEKRLGSFAEQTDGQIRGLKHDIEALQKQFSNESRRKP